MSIVTIDTRNPITHMVTSQDTVQSATCYVSPERNLRYYCALRTLTRGPLKQTYALLYWSNVKEFDTYYSDLQTPVDIRRMQV